MVMPSYTLGSVSTPSPWGSFVPENPAAGNPQALPAPQTSSTAKQDKADLPRNYTIVRGQPQSTWPPIFQAMYAIDPQSFEAILNQSGRISITIPKRPPEKIIEAIETISVKSQETFISTWLSHFIKQGLKPSVTQADQAKHPTINFDQCFHEIQQYAESQLQISAPGADPTLVFRFNTAITPLRKDIMASNIEFESYNERAKTAKGIFYTVAGASALGYAIEYVPFLKPLERFKEKILSQLDDYGNWSGEIASVKGQGYSWSQVASSQWLAIPAIAWTAMTDLSFREKGPVLDKTGVIKKRFGKPLSEGIQMNHWPSRLLRGMKLGLAGGILSIFASLSTLGLMVYQHRKLTHEGKAHTDQLNGFQSYWNSIKEAFAQTIQYPARVGLFLGSAIAIGFAGLAALIKLPKGIKNKSGNFLLSMVLIQALVGVGETVGATLASLTARKRNERHLNKIIAGYIPGSQPAPI